MASLKEKRNLNFVELLECDMHEISEAGQVPVVMFSLEVVSDALHLLRFVQFELPESLARLLLAFPEKQNGLETVSKATDDFDAGKRWERLGGQISVCEETERTVLSSSEPKRLLESVTGT